MTAEDVNTYHCPPLQVDTSPKLYNGRCVYLTSVLLTVHLILTFEARKQADSIRFHCCMPICNTLSAQKHIGCDRFA